MDRGRDRDRGKLGQLPRKCLCTKMVFLFEDNVMIKKPILALSIMLLSPPVIAQEPSAPPVDQAKWQKWIPPHWKLLMVTQGSLSKGSAADVVLVMEEDNAKNVIANDQLGAQTLNLNPRRLVILSPTTSGYRKTYSADHFLPSESDAESSCLSDPLMSEGGIEIAKGLLKIELGYWLSCGSYGVTHRTFTFRKEQDQFRLIGLDSLSYSRSSGEGTQYSSNYLTGRQKVTEGITVIEPDEAAGDAKAPKPTVHWKRFAPAKFTLDAMDMAQCVDYDTGPVWCRD